MTDERPPDEQRPRDPAKWTERITERKAWRRATMPHRPGAEFFDAAEPIIKSRHTIMAYDKLYALWQVAKNVADVPGSVAEVGAYRGGSAYFLAGALAAFTGDEVPMHVFDTFEGHPSDAITEHDTVHQAGHYATANFRKVVAYLSPFKRLQVHRGDISALLPRLSEDVYRLVHVDTNLYKPTRDCLEYFGRRMAPGGVIVVDDYSSENCPGVEKASLEYLNGASGRFAVWDLRTEQLILVARGRA